MPRPEEHLSPLRPLDPGEAEQLAERMAVFATASRLRLLYALGGGERSVDELAELTGLASSAASQQLRVLRHLRFVVARRDGRRMIYRLHDDHIADLLSAIRHQHEHAQHGWSDRPPAPATRRRVRA
jgi:ArsR family transcriptional regulator, nickel/cobalt-responsive transcriptional repressor